MPRHGPLCARLRAVECCGPEKRCPRSREARRLDSKEQTGYASTVLLVDLDQRPVRRAGEQRPTPLLVNHRAIGRKAGFAQPPLDRLEPLVGNKVECNSGASLPVSGDRGVVQAKLTPSCAQLDPMPTTRPRLRVQTERLVKTLGLGQVGTKWIGEPSPCRRGVLTDVSALAARLVRRSQQPHDSRWMNVG